MTNVTLYIEHTGHGRQLVAEYEEGSYLDLFQFIAGIPHDWTDRDVRRLIKMPGSKMYPSWEIPARAYASPMLMCPKSG
jgi:hypothetical protein